MTPGVYPSEKAGPGLRVISGGTTLSLFPLGRPLTPPPLRSPPPETASTTQAHTCRHSPTAEPAARLGRPAGECSAPSPHFRGQPSGSLPPPPVNHERRGHDPFMLGIGSRCSRGACSCILAFFGKKTCGPEPPPLILGKRGKGVEGLGPTGDQNSVFLCRVEAGLLGVGDLYQTKKPTATRLGLAPLPIPPSLTEERALHQ